jgi:CDP-diacylglycerol---glycerol-3-phosphate 3-phosphatidyltransferase
MKSTSMKLAFSTTPYRMEWMAMAALFAGLLSMGATILSGAFNITNLSIWTISTGAILFYQLVHLGLHLKHNVPSGRGVDVFPSLGLANWMTMTRAALLALLAGFTFVPRPEGWAAWLPGALYSTAALIDFFDGYVARITGRSSRLGEILDMHWDGFGMLVASWLLVHYGQVQPWFLVIGLARYLFLGGMRYRELRGWENYPWPPSMIRRAMAGAMMGFVAVVLLPVFSPPSTHIAAFLFATPFLFGFTRDWLAVSGVLKPPTHSKNRGGMANEALPIFLRVMMCGLLGTAMVAEIQAGVPRPGVLWVSSIAILAILPGLAGRVAALAVVLMSGLVLGAEPGIALYWAILMAGIGLFFVGTGRYSLWKPEDWLIYHRAGEVNNRK